jgi:CubicO group peptidase (beta-lactamase class C family)
VATAVFSGWMPVLVLRGATGKPVTQYLEEKIWQRIGTENDATWILDVSGQETGHGLISASLRDWARLGRLLANDRNWEGQVIPKKSPLDYISAASGLISTVMDLAKYDVAIDRDMVYSPGAKQQIWTAAKSPTGQRFPYGLGWFVWEPFTRFIWHYGWYTDAFSSLLFKIPDRELTLILLACTDRASSVFWLGNGDPLRSAFVTAFLDSSASDR